VNSATLYAIQILKIEKSKLFLLAVFLINYKKGRKISNIILSLFLFLDPRSQKKTILEVLYEVGFNSKSVFSYEGANDSNDLRDDPIMKIACDKLPISDSSLASQPTMCRFETNQFRLFLHSIAYVLLHTFGRLHLKNTEFANAQFNTIRLKLLKIGGRVRQLKTKVKIHLTSSFMLKNDFMKIWISCCSSGYKE